MSPARARSAERRRAPPLEAKKQPEQQRAAETVERILEATAAALADIGFERLSTNIVCARAGLTPPALYRYFPNKYALLYELGRRLMQRQNALVPLWITPQALTGSTAELERALAGLLIDKVFGGLVPLRFVSFALVGALGVLVHLSVLVTLRETTGMAFEVAQACGTVVAMIFNFELNNVVTYRDQRLRGPRLWRGLLLFMLVCGLGAVANIGIARALYAQNSGWSASGIVGAMVGAVWNYAVSATLVWRSK